MKRQYLKFILAIALPFALLMAYSVSDVQLASLEKVSVKDGLWEQWPLSYWTVAPADTSVVEENPLPELDTLPQNILFFGDSMLEGLSKRFSDYAFTNGHTLNSVIWYSSSSKVWSQSDTLEHFIRKYDPSYIVICLGANELFVNDLDKRDEYIKTLLGKVGDIPYVWIGPPNWKPDTGIDSLINLNVGNARYFDSSHLELERKKDHAHPTVPAAVRWMDTVAVWLCDPYKTAHPIKMDFPDTTGVKNHLTLLMPPK